MRANRTRKASEALKLQSRIRVMMLASPSLMPGMGIGTGIMLSTMKIVSAITVKTDKVAIFLILMRNPFYSGLVGNRVRHLGVGRVQFNHKGMWQADNRQK